MTKKDLINFFEFYWSGHSMWSGDTYINGLPKLINAIEPIRSNNYNYNWWGCGENNWGDDDPQDYEEIQECINNVWAEVRNLKKLCYRYKKARNHFVDEMEKEGKYDIEELECYYFDEIPQYDDLSYDIHQLLINLLKSEDVKQFRKDYKKLDDEINSACIDMLKELKRCCLKK